MKFSTAILVRSVSRGPAIGLALGLALIANASFAQLVDITSAPLYGGLQPHPNVAVSVSVEFPTAGWAYGGAAADGGDPVYMSTKAYPGYFDTTRCYQYSTASGGYFYPDKPASAKHECSNGFSGNFMNWATMSAIDEFRYAMTGGNRVDILGPRRGTFLERAYLPDGSVLGVASFYASGNFPRQTVAPKDASAVLPDSIVGGGGGGDEGDREREGKESARGKETLKAVVKAAATPAPVPPKSISITNCRGQVFFGSSTSASDSCDAPSDKLGRYNVRVLTCDATEGPVRTDLCLKYGTGPSAPYRPVGEVQRNAGKMRFSAFGYLMDRSPPPGCADTGWNRCRYGGVLRAPMKYVGPVQYDARLSASPNPKSEINADGSFVADPEGDAASAGGSFSGFINYINKFGSTGVYKRYDTMGEMYYEAIRYFQNLGPTPEAIGGTLTDETKDYFPVTTKWTDPVLSRCSANYIINLSDANTWDDSYLPGYSGTPAPSYRPGSRAVEGGLDVVDWTRRIGVLESTTSSLVPDDVRPGLKGLESRLEPTDQTATYFPAGAAYWANTNDIRTDLEGKQTIKTISFDVAESSKAAIPDRAMYLMGKYGGFYNTKDRVEDGTQQNPFWAVDRADTKGPAIRSNSEWEDPAKPGFPANYLLASNPQKLIDGLRAAFSKISAVSGTLSGASLTSANLTYGAAGAYTATFDPATWSGSVLHNLISVDPKTGLLTVSAAPVWDSGTLLTARCGSVASASTVCTDTDTSVDKRNIVTLLEPGGKRVAANFTWADISTDASYKAALDADSKGRERLNYLRGYRADEAGALGFRSRASVMGDIVNSSPVYVGPPTTSIPDPDYQAFYKTNNARAPAVYVGANDGMLHALRATTGQELFAYVPGFSTADLKDLTDPGYVHKSFVDAAPAIQEAQVGGTWKTVLVSGVGNGAQGVFALDVTDPTAFGPGKVLFEFSDADDADFGNVTTSPEIVKLQTGAASGVPVYKYFAVVTGYNNRRPDSSVSSDTGNRGVLFLLSLDHRLDTAWTLGSDYYKFYFPASSLSAPNGLGPVTAVRSRSGSGATAAMYFGDLQGNFWRLNTVGDSPSAWIPSRGTVAAPLPMFVAQDALGTRQPITARPEVASGPFGTSTVFFGTGRFLGETDLRTPYAPQSEYALIDNNSSFPITRSDLLARTAEVSGTGVKITGPAFVYRGPGAKKGWYLDFPGSASAGERSITKPAVRTGLLTFTTLTLAGDVCGGGSGYVYQVNALTGLPLGSDSIGGYASTVGIPGPPRIVDLTEPPGRLRATGEQINKKTQTTLVSGTLGKIAGIGSTEPTKAPPVGRINWREITNWNDRR